MRTYTLLLVTIMSIALFSCSKSGSNGGGGSGNGGGSSTKFPFENNEYTGTFTELSRFYQKPMLLHFGPDSTVIAYAVFYLSVNNQPYLQDSLAGKIIKLGSGSDGNPAVTVFMKATADTQVWTFSPDYSAVNGGSNGLASNQFYATDLQKCPAMATSLANTFWTTDSSKVIKNDGYYPDIDGITFLAGGNTNYQQNGSLQNTGPEGIPPDQTVEFSWVQNGSMVNFFGSGVTPNNVIISVKYFGVLSPDGTLITADTRDPNARLPLNEYGSSEYGEYGNPPTMHKH